MNCTCCMVYDTNIYEGTARIEGVNSIALDVNFNYDWWDDTDEECNPLATKIDLLGPSIGTINISAYAFDPATPDPQGYLNGLTCPIDINVTIPWKYIWDCHECSECIDPLTGETTGRRWGKWIGVRGKKSEVKVTGEIGNVSFMTLGTKLYRVNKFSAQAGQQLAFVPQSTYLYSSFQYNYRPLIVDTEVSYVYEMSVVPNKNCPVAYGITNMDAYLTNFNFKFEPPNPPMATYTFQYYIWFCTTT